MKPARWESFSPLRAISGSPSVSTGEAVFAGGSGEVRDGHWGGAGGTVPGGEGKGPVEWGAAWQAADAHPGLAAFLQSWGQRQLPHALHSRTPGRLPRHHGDGQQSYSKKCRAGHKVGFPPAMPLHRAMDYMVQGQAAHPHPPRSAQRSPLVPGVSKEGMARHAFPSPV